MVKTQLIFITALIAFLPFHNTHFNIYKTHHETCNHITTTDNDCDLSTFNVQIANETEAIDFAKNLSSESVRKYSPNYRIKKVVIDPGHGGHDGGCSGSASTEKHIALSIAKKMKAKMEAQHPDIQVILTRDCDIFIPLNRRAAIANEIQADLFISVHCNSIRNADYITGSETYVLGAHKFKENLDVAKRENASVLFEDNYAQTYNFDPNSDEGHITMSLYQNAYLEQSLLFASQVEKNVKDHTSMHSRGVKQAGFLVLRETTMPSVLIETGYLTNGSDQAYLNSAAGQNRMASVIAKAFSEYRMIMEKGESTASIAVRAAPIVPKRNGGAPYRRQEPRQSIISQIIAPESPGKAVILVQQENRNNPTKSIAKSGDVLTKTYIKPRVSTIQYRVQLAASKKSLDTSKGRWLNIPEYLIEVVREKGLLKYQARGFYSFAQANAARHELGVRGFEGAWIVAYKRGEKISISQAKEELGEN
ncbi:MAG: N-acetylmuramoyl-L-alanine amidase [Saprospiraceae bacterium]|jgi:N-acetylmuramoyl-L-alanine amidase